MEQIKAPFTDEQVKALNEYQDKGRFHPFTCIGQMKEQEDENGKFKERTRRVCQNDGKLIATNNGWVHAENINRIGHMHSWQKK